MHTDETVRSERLVCLFVCLFSFTALIARATAVCHARLNFHCPVATISLQDIKSECIAELLKSHQNKGEGGRWAC